MAQAKKQYTVEEAQKIVREKLTGLKAPEATIKSWEENMVTNRDRDFLVGRLASGESYFERKADGSFTIVVETDFGGPMFEGMSKKERDAVMKKFFG